jgi:hypothetical protein
MATAETFDTYKAVGIREDLIDVIYNIAPTDTPFVSNVGSGSAKGRTHDWQKDTLAPVEDNPIAEGADAEPVALAATTRLSNYAQINDKTFVISGSDLVADNAGRGVEMAYQEAKKGLELRKDVEYVCVGVNKSKQEGTGNAGGSPTARQCAPVLAWLGATNSNKEATGIDPAGDGTGTGQTDTTEGRTDGVARPFTEAMLQDVIDQIYLSGGSPDMIMAPTTQKRVITNTFKGSADSRENMTNDKRIVNAVDFYEGDYGTLAVVPNRYMRTTDVFVLDSDMWSVDYYRPYFTQDLAKTGDNDKKQMIVEWTLTSKEEASSGGVFDLS